MRKHPAHGRDVIVHAEQDVGVPDDAILAMAKDIVYTHHEKWDGTGYPQGLRGAQIPVVGQADGARGRVRRDHHASRLSRAHVAQRSRGVHRLRQGHALRSSGRRRLSGSRQQRGTTLGARPNDVSPRSQSVCATRSFALGTCAAEMNRDLKRELIAEPTEDEIIRGLQDYADCDKAGVPRSCEPADGIDVRQRGASRGSSEKADGVNASAGRISACIHTVRFSLRAGRFAAGCRTSCIHPRHPRSPRMTSQVL